MVRDGVPARVYDPGGADGLLLFGHGGGHSKDSERVVRLCRRYADGTGLAVACIDAVDHGERRPNAASPGLPPRWHSNTIEQMAADWRIAAESLASTGPAVAYVGFSMGMIFGVSTLASIPSITAAVFGVGGIPTGSWIDDPPLSALLLDAASQLDETQLLMINKTHDEFFPVEEVHRFFDAVPGKRKRLMFWEGDHDDWPIEAIDLSIDFVNEHVR
jgi:pimeloyl-ACP methyl ester carboxylesterase